MSPQKTSSAGLPSTSEPAFLVLGKLRRPHGVKGEIPLELYSDLLNLLSPGETVYVGDDHRELTIAATRWKQDLLLLKFMEINDRTLASDLTNKLVMVKSQQLEPLPEGQLYDHELIGFTVVAEDGRVLGTLQEILKTGANDVYLIQDDDGQEILIPAIDSVILATDLVEKRMTVAELTWYEGED